MRKQECPAADKETKKPRIRMISFTDRGGVLANRIASALGAEAIRCGAPHTLDAWTKQAFAEADALVYVGAAGIAVRAIAPYINDKTTDPAVVVADETGQFVIPLLSGHLGGANDLARQIAKQSGATCVITTATDRNGVFAVDAWARCQQFAVVNKEKIKIVSAKLLAGGQVAIRSDIPVAGDVPDGIILCIEKMAAGDAPEGIVLCTKETEQRENADVVVSAYEQEGDALHLVPGTLVLGAGCKAGTRAEELQAFFDNLCRTHHIRKEAFRTLATIDRKEEEAGLKEFCEQNNLRMQTFTAAELEQTPGTFADSAFVKEAVGTGNVCERSAVLASGGTLRIPKQAHDGITMAVAEQNISADWRETDA